MTTDDKPAATPTRAQLAALGRFLDAAAVEGGLEEAALEQMIGDMARDGVIPAGPVTAEELSSLSPEDRARIGLPETGPLDPSMLRRRGVTDEPALAVIDPLMDHLAAEDTPAEPS